MATSSFTSSVSVTKRSAQSLSKVMNKVEKPTLNTEQMKFILERRHSYVKKLRIEMIAKFKEEGIKLYSNKRIPTELFLKYIGRNMQYYERKMIQEAKLRKYKGESK